MKKVIFLKIGLKLVDGRSVLSWLNYSPYEFKKLTTVVYHNFLKKLNRSFNFSNVFLLGHFFLKILFDSNKKKP